jgi:hypothetical protein
VRKPGRSELIDLTGERFGKLIVVARSGRSSKPVRWRCRCDCGEPLVVIGASLKSGRTKSCGCFKADRITHGASRRNSTSPEYQCWTNIKQRCLNPNNDRYEDWGGRGIRICERWANSFENFFADVGPRPSPAHSLDRKNNDGRYEPGNCRWATKSEQQLNQRNAWRRLVVASEYAAGALGFGT